jgi:RNA polymerase sigma-70 factor (ECF subfamily)
LQDQTQQFERVIWPHLRGAYNLARWLVGNRQDAEDVVQDAFMKAFSALATFRGGDWRPWLLAIVRNTALNHLQRRKSKTEAEWSENVPDPIDHKAGPEDAVLSEERRNRVRDAIERLPREFREPLILREIEGLAYKEIAWVLNIPIGTVMSRLSRARALLIHEFLLEKGAVR